MTLFFPSKSQFQALDKKGILPDKWWNGFPTNEELEEAINNMIKESDGEYADKQGKRAETWNKYMLLKFGYPKEDIYGLMDAECKAKVAEVCNRGIDFHNCKMLHLGYNIPIEVLVKLNGEEHKRLYQMLNLRMFGKTNSKGEDIINVRSIVLLNNPKVGGMLPMNDQLENVVVFPGEDAQVEQKKRKRHKSKKPKKSQD